MSDQLQTLWNRYGVCFLFQILLKLIYPIFRKGNRIDEHTYIRQAKETKKAK